MKILHVCWDLNQGGIQRYLIDLLTAFKGTVNSDIMVLSDPGALSQDAVELSGKVEYIGMKRGTDLQAFFPILKLLKSGEYDVIHSHANNLVFNFALGFQPAPVIYTEHGGRFLNRDLASAILYKYMNRNIDRFVAISAFMGNLMRARNPVIGERLRVIYNGIQRDDIFLARVAEEALDIRAELPEGPKVGFVGRLTKEKGVDLFIDIARAVHQSNPDTQFLIIGDGPCREESQALVREYGLEDRVHFLGYVKHARGLFSALDVFVISSRYEAFGLVTVESMAAGVPVVALSENSAVAELVRDGVDGFLIDGLDTSEAAKRVQQILSEPELKGKMGEAGRQRSREFTISRNAEKVIQEYHDLVHAAEDSGK
jgi:glycosyltransferase involved in cell wall biosynthesis